MQISNSTNISLLDFAVTINLKDGKFTIGLQPSVFIGSGATNVQGASIRVKSPFSSILIKDYPTTGFDIEPPNMLTGTVDVSIPESVNIYQYGNYSISVKLTDANGTVYETDYKNVKVCAPNPQDTQKKYGSLSAQLNADCKGGKLYVIVDGVPSYQGVLPFAETYDYSLQYPYGALAKEEHISGANISFPLFEGQYKVDGVVDATYNLPEHVSALVEYQIKREKKVSCLLNKECIAERLSSLVDQMNSDCSLSEQKETEDTIFKTILLLEAIESNVDAGYDVSDFIEQLEEILGCVCTCNCNPGTPVSIPTPSNDFDIVGCGFTKVVSGLTTTYTINNYEYVVVADPSNEVVTVSSGVVSGCKVTRTIGYNVQKAYEKTKSQINNTNEYNYWAAVIKASLTGLDVSCLNITNSEFASMTYKSFIQKVLDKLCSGASCSATIGSVTTTKSGSDVNISWVQSNAFQVSVFVDGVLVAAALSGTTSLKLKGYADGEPHTYTIVTKCSNGSNGQTGTGVFEYDGCPSIALPDVTSNYVSNAVCPYDLSSLIGNIPTGITIEWHTANSTLASTLVSNPSAVNSGTYYAFAKNSDGCYSDSFKTNIVCAGTTSCSAPQNMTVDSITSGVRIRFQSAAYPPPLNSYSVQRRLQSDPDIPASYTNIGAASWNASANRWEVLDTTAVINNIYVYKAISNCSSGQPFVLYTFAYINCVLLNITESQNSIAFSFPSSAMIAKYDVILYADNGVTQIDKKTFTPAYPATISDSFSPLLIDTNYKLKVVSWLGTYQNDCVMQTAKTLPAASVIPIYGAMQVGASNTTIEINELNLTIGCPVTFTIPFVYTNGGVDTSSSAVITVAANADSATVTPTIPGGAVIKEISVANIIQTATCLSSTYKYTINRLETGGGGIIVEYGYASLDTTGATPTEVEYVASIADPTSVHVLTSFGVSDPMIISFPNTTDKVVFVKIPDTVTVKQFWSEIGNPLQQNQPIDPDYGTGSNVFFVSNLAPAGSYYIISRSQTSFGGNIQFD